MIGEGMTLKWFATLAAVASLAVVHPGPACASSFSVVDVTLDTSPLTVAPGMSSAPFSLIFQLTDGSGTNDGNNTVNVDNFVFGGGGSTLGATLFGGASGGLGSGIVLTDTSFLNFFTQGFTPGGLLSFRVSMTTNVDAGGTPDAFAFSVLDSSGFPIATTDPTLADTLLTVNIDSANPTYLTYGTDVQRTNVVMSAPSVEPAPAPVPEPGTLSLFGTACVGFVGHRFRRRRTS
jgi:hypothetical protein